MCIYTYIVISHNVIHQMVTHHAIVQVRLLMIKDIRKSVPSRMFWALPY